MSKEIGLYFIALVPPEPIYSQVLEIKHQIALNYSSKAALKSPPHITLHMPFRVKDKKMDPLDNMLDALSSRFSSFEVELANFNHFGERVIYIEVLKSDNLAHLHSGIIDNMKKSLNIFNANHKNRAFNPHMTVAFRDLKKEAFNLAWNKYQSAIFNQVFRATCLTLLKHNGQIWERYKDYFFR